MQKLNAARCFTSGIALAPAFVVKEQSYAAAHTLTQDQDAEQSRFQNAVQSVAEELTVLAERDEIFAAHLELVQDPSIAEDVAVAITDEGKNAEWAVEDVIASYAALFDQMEDEYMRARGADIRDIGKRLLLKLKGLDDNRLSGICESCIIIAKDLTPSDTANMDLSLVSGFITEEGGVTSHVAIMAKSMGIPALVGVSGILEAVQDGDFIAMDAASGEIVVSPDVQMLTCYRAALEKQARYQALLKTAVELPAQTKDGREVALYANVGGLTDIERALECGAMGVGLFRTEFLYMENTHFPTEEEQYAVYAEAARRMGERELIVRTLDIGGDKQLPYFTFDAEENPFLGYRAIRLCLGDHAMFKTQLRALLRAAACGNLRIMYPMMVCMEELNEAQALLAECKAELRAEGATFNENVKVGMMIETPASVLMADRFARHVDFFSIGTNDLTQYVLAADRGNRKLSYLYDTFRPAVLRAIQTTISAGHAAGIPVGMCGEFASDPKAFPLLLGMGLDEFSVSAARIPELKLRLQSLTAADAQQLAQTALTCDTTADVMACLNP